MEKKAVSLMVGYVLLISFAIIIGIFTYAWIKSYAPSDSLECQEGISAFIKEASWDPKTTERNLTVTVKNTGRFDFGGFFIRIKNDSNQEIAAIDISSYIIETLNGGRSLLNAVVYLFGQNVLKPGEERTSIFDIPSNIGNPEVVEITPVRWQTFQNQNKLVSCEYTRVQQIVGKPGGESECIPDCTGKVCGSDGCGGSCGTCTDPEVCDAVGQCVPPEECTDTCSTYGYVCGTQTICGVSVDCSAEIGGCSAEESCVNGQCVAPTFCGDGIIQNPNDDGINEECDDGDFENFDGCTSCQIDSGWSCTEEPSECTYGGGGPSCDNYCLSLGTYTNGGCVTPPNQGQCNLAFPGSTYSSGGNQECTLTGASGAGCCCIP